MGIFYANFIQYPGVRPMVSYSHAHQFPSWPGSVLVDLHLLCLLYVRRRVEPALHQYVVMETREGARDMCEAIEERWESLCYWVRS